MPAGYAFLPGDICTHNRFECRVESVDELTGKIRISFAVFIDGNRTFDETDTKLVAPSRLKLVQRCWNESLLRSVEALSPRTPREFSSARKSVGITPSFSERQKSLNEDSDKENRGMSDFDFTSPQSALGSSSLMASEKRKKLSLEKSPMVEKKVGKRSSSKRSKSNSAVKRKSLGESPIILDSSYSVPKPRPKRRKSIDDSPCPIVPDSYVDSPYSVLSSARHKKKGKRRKSIDDSPIPIVADSYVDSSYSVPRKVQNKTKGKRRKSVDEYSIPIVSDSYEDSQYSSHPIKRKVVKRKFQNKRQKVVKQKPQVRVSLKGETPIPIIPDSYEISDHDSGSFPLPDSMASDSQERDHMHSLARAYEQRARGGYRASDEVVFEWDNRNVGRRNPSTASSFIVQDTPPLTVEKKSLDSVFLEFPAAVFESTTVELIRRVWTFVDELHVAPEMIAVEKTIEFLAKAVSIMNCNANIAAELRMTFTHPSFGLKSMTGWIASIATVALVVWRFKKQLFSDFIEKIAEKCDYRFELKVCFAIALLNLHDVVKEHSLCSPPAIQSALSQYANQNSEGKDLLEILILSFIKSGKSAALLLPSLGSIFGSLAAPPSEITGSQIFKLQSEFSKIVSKFSGSELPSVSYLPLLVKGGGFLPPMDIGQQRVDFGKHRGMAFQHLIKDKGFSDWTERISDPSSVSFVSWLDFILWHRQVCVIGPRTVRADVELLRLTCERKLEEKTILWAENRAIICLRAIDFFENMKLRTQLVGENLAYARCMYEVLRRVSENRSLEQLESLARPRGEIIKEFFRPMIRLGTLVPSLKPRIVNALVAVRAITHECSHEQARTELISIHSLPL